MARTFTLSDGTTTINFLDTTGYQAKRLGAKSLSVDANVPAGHLRYIETYDLYLFSTDQDDAATQLQSLYELLRKAHLYQTTSWQNVPVYITAQTDNETNARYALVYGVPSIATPDFFAIPFASGDLIDDVSVTLIRGVWRSGIPGVTPTAATLSKTDASADATTAVVVNGYEVGGFSYLLSDPDGVGNNTYYYGTDTPGAGFYFDSDGAATTDIRGHGVGVTSTSTWHTAVIDLATAGVFTSPSFAVGTLDDGVAWKTIAEGSDYLWYVEGAASTDTFDLAWLQKTGLNILSFSVPSSDITAVDLSDPSAAGSVFAARWLASTDTLITTAPIQSSDQAYIQQKPYIELSSDTLKGDIPAIAELRMFGMYGQTDSDATFGATSKIIMGARSRFEGGGFESHLNCGGAGLPSTDWAVSYDTDTTGNAASSNADARAPGGYVADCTFAASTQKTRVSFVGDNLVDAYRGEYKAFLRAEQVGGTDGDISVALKIGLGSTDPASPSRLGQLVDLSTHDKGWEIVDLGQFSIPFVDAADTDDLDGDIVFDIQAVQNTATVTCLFADLILIPVDEWAFVLDDPVSDNSAGASALRGNRRLDVDSGVLGHRAALNIKTGTSYMAGENWFYGGRPFHIEPGRLTRIYFLMGHYHSDLGWGVEPIMSTIAQSLVVELRSQALYLSLRGAD